MMIAEIREFLVSRIKSLDSKLIEARGTYFNDDIPESLIEKTFLINFGNMSDFLRTQYREFTLGCTISLFTFAKRKEKENFDRVYQNVLCIVDDLTSVQNLTLKDILINSTCSSVEPSQVDTNEDLFRFDINLDLRIAYLKEQ